MRIIRDIKYIQKLQSIMEYIAKDSITQALKFQMELDETITNIPNMLYKHRQSIYFEDEHIRDIIFKGYVVPYHIDKLNDVVTIIGINKYMENL
jgi:hypothetical protein